MSETVKTDNQTSATVNETVAYEPKDVNARAIFWVGVVMLIAAIVIHTVVWLLFDAFDRREAEKGRPPATLVQMQRPAPPEPRLQTNAPSDLNSLRDAENHELETYGWVDQQKGIVRIPVGQAMTLLVERGLPKTQATANENNGAQTNAQSQGQKQ
jgi:hypothetical protein